MCHRPLNIHPRGLPAGRVHDLHHHLKEKQTHEHCIHTVIGRFFWRKILNNMLHWHTDYELTVSACDEHRSFLFFGSLWLFGSHGFLWWGGKGDGQVAGVLGGSSRTDQSCGAFGDWGAATIVYPRGGTAAVSNLLMGRSSGHYVDHGLLVALLAGTNLKWSDQTLYLMNDNIL